MKGKLVKVAIISVMGIMCLDGLQVRATDTAASKVLTAGVDNILANVEDVSDVDVTALTWGYKNLGVANVENHLNIRAVASTDGKLVGKMSNNAACEIISISNGWAQIKSGEVEGYVNLEFLLLGEAARERANQVVSTVATVTADSLKVREQPNTDCEVITQVPTGEELDVVDTNTQGWVKVLLDDEEVFVASEYVSVAEQLKTAVTMTELLYGEGVSDLRVDLCQYAKEFLGNAYVWGGSSLTKGTDCSGFTMSVYKNFGYSLSHSSRAQASYGTKVSVSEAVAGDLVFYAKGGTINHVAIYIGNGQVIHASSPSTGIRISSVYYRTPYTVRRILP